MFHFLRDEVGEYSPRHQRIAYGNDCIEVGLFGQFIGALGLVAMRKSAVVAPFWISVSLITLGTVLIVVGCMRHMHRKGYSPRWGLLGVFSLPAVLVFWLMQDRNGRDGSRRGFEVVQPRKVSTTWVMQEDDPRYRPRAWADVSEMAKLWRQGRESQ